VRALVTGVAGFIGSHLADALLADGHEVVGIDAFTPYYDPERKRANLESALGNPAFRLVAADLLTAGLGDLLDGIDVVFHQAAQPGVRASWADGFATYMDNNVLATQRLLEAAREGGIERFVHASSSSVYGNAPAYPTTETDVLNPHSPYGVSKLAAEHLVRLYAHNWGVPAVSLRYFTVYGPRQRPDMATHRLIEAGLRGTTFPLYGAADNVRDFTYVGDVVRANLLAATCDVEPGTVLNIAGGSTVRMRELMALVADLTGGSLHIDDRGAHAGDVVRTGGAVDAARAVLGWTPDTDLADGVAAQVAWHRSLLPSPSVRRSVRQRASGA
jgi:UDP-glucuronate 4-epimerase